MINRGASADRLSQGSLSFLDALAAFNTEASAAQWDLKTLREGAKRLRAPWNEGGPQMARSDALLVRAGKHDVPLRIHVPDGAEAATATILYLHGGGWTLLDLSTHDRAMREIAAACAVPVVGVDYPRAPETRFPEIVSVCSELVTVCREGAAGRLPAHLILAGDSAGANLAAATALALRDGGKPMPDGLVLIYGVYDCDLTRASYARYGDAPFQLTAEKMDWFWQQYVAAPDARSAPLASPLRAELGGLPPTHLIIAGADVLADENEAFAAALAAADVPVSVDRRADLPHGFIEALALIPEGHEAVQAIAHWLAAQTGQATARG